MIPTLLLEPTGKQFHNLSYCWEEDDKVQQVSIRISATDLKLNPRWIALYLRRLANAIEMKGA